ncbi:YigZ family protein [uncultured Eubacterium sp.]|uniref:YigZ family protein n=1 Tax=uncultured Eubacterium sp. TaxID=165185 RepID=UPI0025EE699B|nr:YigZ family protein [uncultured Eubacterium sp.]
MSYKVLYQAGQGEIEEKKSRFIAHTLPVSSEEEAVTFLNKIKKEYWDARHNCHAYTIGKNNECTRCSDDGEPSGTAGRPILDVLLREEIHNCIVVVTRYFGGTLLGTGGLVRAYQAAAQAGLAASTIIEKQFGHKLHVTTDYNGIGKLQYLVAQNQIFTLDTQYTDNVTLDLMIPEEKFMNFCAEITEVTSGRAVMDSEDLVEFGVVDGEIIF